MLNSIRSLLVALLLFLAPSFPAQAQEDRYKMGGGAGFSFPSDPELELQRGFDVGGFFGVRFNDNLSVEAGFSYSKSDRQFTGDTVPADVPGTGQAAIDLESARYHLDAVLVYNLGRRQPFHPFLFGGAGLVREDRATTDLTPLLDPDVDPSTVVLERTTTVEYRPVATFGAGFDFYVLSNVAARGEGRMWLPSETGLRTWRLFFAATLFF